MDKEFGERFQALLRELGFHAVTKHSSPHSVTLSAQKGDLRAVVHLTDQDEVPRRAGLADKVPAKSEILMKATLPGISGAPVSGVTGGGGGDDSGLSLSRPQIGPATQK